MYHEPVLLKESIRFLQVEPGKHYVDATAGGGGHTSEILARGGIVLALDKDIEAIDELQRKFNGNRSISIKRENFRRLEAAVQEWGVKAVDGILFDLGVSSHQLNSIGRGFSMKYADAPLDMRMSEDEVSTAADIVNTASEAELYEIFARFGEEERAIELSQALVYARKRKPVRTVGDFMEATTDLIQDKQKLNRMMARSFQALRIRVNDELTSLETALKASERVLKSGGRCAVISFHSLEDRIVKRTFGNEPWSVVTKRPITPTFYEIQNNSRSRSAKLRVAQLV